MPRSSYTPANSNEVDFGCIVYDFDLALGVDQLAFKNAPSGGVRFAGVKRGDKPSAEAVTTIGHTGREGVDRMKTMQLVTLALLLRVTGCNGKPVTADSLYQTQIRMLNDRAEAWEKNKVEGRDGDFEEDKRVLVAFSRCPYRDQRWAEYEHAESYVKAKFRLNRAIAGHMSGGAMAQAFGVFSKEQEENEVEKIRHDYKWEFGLLK